MENRVSQESRVNQVKMPYLDLVGRKEMLVLMG